MNPLLEPSSLPFKAIPFDELRASHFMPALKELVAEGKVRLDRMILKFEGLKEGGKRPSLFTDTVEELEKISTKIGDLSNVFFSLHGAESDDEVRAVAKEFSPLLTEFYNDILLDPQIFKAVKECHQRKDELPLNPEQKKLVEEWFLDFKRNGALLGPEQKDRLRQIDQRLSKLSLEFGDNILKETNKHFLAVSDKSQLSGLPDFLVEKAADEAKTRGIEGQFAFTLDYPCFSVFMKYADNRELRKQLFLLFSSRAYKSEENSNRGLVLEMSKLRWERARLLGHPTHADFVLEKRMAQTPSKVNSFLQELLTAARPFAMAEMEELSQFQRKDFGLERIERWDYAYLSEKLRKLKFDIDDEILRPYFKLENVVKGVFTVAGKLYGLSFVPATGIPVYHPDVKVYEVKDESRNKSIGLFYADFHPRKGKKSGAWMTVLKEQRMEDGKDLRPHISIVCNFTEPTATAPALLTLDEVKTLFHEFGHALHGLLSECQYTHFSGTNVYWDFVELPSQILENWVFEKQCLDLFAEHYETGAKIPDELVRKIRASGEFHEGYNTMRQLSFAFLDMAWHGVDPSAITEIDVWEKKAITESSILPLAEGTNTSCTFSHIFGGGYSAGYYSYKWAEVLDADAFEFFQERGIFSKEVAGKFRDCILSKGGTEHPAELYRRFRGKDPDIKPLLKRAGLHR